MDFNCLRTAIFGLQGELFRSLGKSFTSSKYSLRSLRVTCIPPIECACNKYAKDWSKPRSHKSANFRLHRSESLQTAAASLDFNFHAPQTVKPTNKMYVMSVPIKIRTEYRGLSLLFSPLPTLLRDQHLCRSLGHPKSLLFFCFRQRKI